MNDINLFVEFIYSTIMLLFKKDRETINPIEDIDIYNHLTEKIKSKNNKKNSSK
ncbi:hypothetical protein [Tepidibacter mesophilus]|uniref:hypothetical protein n=1 Tax=Tepidibacter mesophilus TaxID=655607 RepID=UPI001650FFDD|nr:hypothetical protein [Tepidibacter mesophilus]